MSELPAVPSASPATQSTTIGQLAAALAVAQGTFEAASKDRANPYFGSRYATLSSVWDACREGLSKNGLAVVQQVSRGGGDVSVRTMLIHASGEWVSSTITLPVLPMQKRDGTETKVTAQSYGSAITYGRRYGLAAAVGIAPDDDDDGNAASHDEPSAPIRPPPSGRSGGLVVPFGKNKGRDIADLDTDTLTNLRDYFLEASQDVKKAQYSASNKANAAACTLELTKREGK